MIRQQHHGGLIICVLVEQLAYMAVYVHVGVQDHIFDLLTFLCGDLPVAEKQMLYGISGLEHDHTDISGMPAKQMVHGCNPFVELP